MLRFTFFWILAALLALITNAPRHTDAPVVGVVTMTAPFLGEFELSSPPALESVRRYLPPLECDIWPPPAEGSFVRHTPTYVPLHLEIMNQYAAEFCDTATMTGLITGMQLAQATGLRQTFAGRGGIPQVKRLGAFVVPIAPQRAVAPRPPLLVVTEVRLGERLAARNVYWLDFRAKPGCLFDPPRTQLSMRAKGGRLLIRNEGAVPAVGVHFECPALSDFQEFVMHRAFWLAPLAVAGFAVLYARLQNGSLSEAPRHAALPSKKGVTNVMKATFGGG